MMTHLGLLWQEFQNDYPSVNEVAPLRPSIESFGEERSVKLALSDVPPMARTWFVHRDETAIVQVQRDRFLHNWKKARDSDNYPRYSRVVELFRDRLATFESFLQNANLGELCPTQYEMTYVNHIEQGHGWNSMAEFGNLFPGFMRGHRKSGFLPDVESCNMRAAYRLPGRMGRLHATIRTTTRDDGKAVIVLDLTARGFPGDDSREAMQTWFDLAREWIVRGFTDLTSEDVQKKEWGRTL